MNEQPNRDSILQEFRRGWLRILVCAFVAVCRGSAVRREGASSARPSLHSPCSRLHGTWKGRVQWLPLPSLGEL